MKYFKAAVLTHHNQALKIWKLKLPDQLEAGQVLVQVHCSGICGAQLGEIAGVKGADKHMPHLMGHEGAGIVQDIGPGVSHVQIGDHVAMHWRKGAGIESRPPRYGRPDVGCPRCGAEFLSHGQCSRHQEGCQGGIGEAITSVGGGWVTTFNEYAVVSENRLTKIDSDVPFEIAALLGCAVTTGLGLVAHEAQLQIGESIAVFGCGGVGLNVIQGAVLASALPIIAIDLRADKLTLARLFGADVTINAADAEYMKAGIVDAWPENLPRPDIAVDTTGIPAVIESAFDILAPGGRLFLVGQVPLDQHIRIQTLAMHAGKRISTSDGGLTNPTVDIPRYLRLWKAKRLKLEPLISHRCSLDEINGMLDKVRAGQQVGRAIIQMR
jgi:S-(hydroxymethyl)glutathione dehydrogenase/alcohol dehydrogenase